VTGNALPSNYGKMNLIEARRYLTFGQRDISAKSFSTQLLLRILSIPMAMDDISYWMKILNADGNLRLNFCYKAMLIL